MTEIKQYSERDAMDLDEVGGYYFRHALAMTAEGLHSKSEIAAELGWRDMQIDALQEQVRALADLVPDAMPAHNKGAHIDATAHWCDGFNACRAAVLRRIDGMKNAK